MFIKKKDELKIILCDELLNHLDNELGTEELIKLLDEEFDFSKEEMKQIDFTADDNIDSYFKNKEEGKLW